jgi:hypothetical protein
MEKQKVFRDCTLDWLEKTFGLEEMDSLDSLKSWLEGSVDISDYEHQSLIHLQNLLQFNVHDWNESELDRHFIGPVFSLVNYSSKKFNLFSERLFEGTVDDWRLYGKPDCFLASGRRNPDKPYFAFQEYKRMTDPDGDPAGQALSAMLAGQAVNNNELPIYGCYVIGSAWYFMSLQGKEYAKSREYSALSNEIFDIFKVLRILKILVSNRFL